MLFILKKSNKQPFDSFLSNPNCISSWMFDFVWNGISQKVLRQTKRYFYKYFLCWNFISLLYQIFNSQHFSQFLT
jgi:hypothetical protein